LLFRAGERFFLFRDHRKLRCHFRVQRDKVFPFFRDVVFVEDGFDRTFRNASFAVDAFVRVNVENLIAFVEAFDRAHDHAVSVLASKAGFANNVCHRFGPFLFGKSNRRLAPAKDVVEPRNRSIRHSL
jgi:hypothetical protein